MTVVEAVRSTASTVKLLAQKTVELPELIEDARRRRRLDMSAMRKHRDLGTLEEILMMEPPKELPDQQIWHSFTEGVLENLKFLNKEVCCVVSIGACAMTTVLFSVFEASGHIEVTAMHFVLLIFWFLISLIGAFLIKMLGLVLFDAATWALVCKMNEKLRIADEKSGLFVYYKVSGWVNAVRVLQLWGPKPPEPTMEAHFANFGSAALAYAMPIPKPGKFGVDFLPACRPNEVELITNSVDSYEVGDVVYSELVTVNDFSFRLAVYPRGFHPKFPCVAAFVEAEAPKDDEWCYRGVKFQVTLINCIDYRISIGRIDEGDFHDVQIDRGWADLLPQELATERRGWVSASGNLVIRAACSGATGRRPGGAGAGSPSPAPPTVYGKAAPPAAARSPEPPQVQSIKSLVLDMTSNVEDADLQRNTARSLYDFCVGKDAMALQRKQEAAEAGALEALVAAMKAHADARLQSWAACPVASICTGDDEAAPQRKQLAVKAGALEVMVAAMNAHRNESKMQIWGACLVDRICQGADVSALARKQQAAEIGWLEALVNAMKAHPDDEDVQFYAAKALYSVCVGKDSALRWKQQAAKAGAIEALVAAMRGHGDDVKLQGSCASALWLLAEDVKLRHLVFKAGCLDALITAMQCHGVAGAATAATRLQGCGACCALQVAWGDDDKALKRRNRAVEVGFAKQLPSPSTLGGLTALLSSSDADLRRAAAWTLWRMDLLTDDPELPQNAVEAGCLEALPSAIESTDAELQRSSINVLYNICVGEDELTLQRKQRASQAGCIESLVEVMRREKTQAELQKDAACALGNLCSGSDEQLELRKLRAAEANAIQAFRDASPSCEGDEELLQAIRDLIRELEAALRKKELQYDGASTVAWLEAAVPMERQHVELEVDDEPPVPEEPIATMPFAISATMTLPSDNQQHYTPSLSSAELRHGTWPGAASAATERPAASGPSTTGPIPVMMRNNCCEPRYVPMPAFAEDMSDLPV